MSNLKLPNMSHGNLKALIGTKDSKTIAYATTAAIADTGEVLVSHHGNLIARVSPNQVWLTNAGWNSQTTIARLHSILQDALPGTEYGIGIRQFNARILRAGKAIMMLERKGVTITSKGLVN